MSLYVFSSGSSGDKVSIQKTNKTVAPKEEIKNEWVEQQLAGMSLREKIGQFFMMAAYSNKTESHLREIDSMVINDKIGGLIYFQGEKDKMLEGIERFQSKSKVPLLIALDAEWGIGMRLFGEDRFPYNYTLGAADDLELSEKIARMIANECKDAGVHMNFAPVADVNNNPKNPVIGFRSFGENPKAVADQVAATVKGMEAQGVLTSIKHFPGHGDTDVDSHYDLPVVMNSLEHIEAIDLFPFRAGVKAGASSVMIGHLNIPALDASGTPSSLSTKIIQDYLIEGMNFKGLVVSDALRMDAVADRYGKTEAVVKAFEAGVDILLLPESLTDAIDAIEKKVKSGAISEYSLNQRCKKILLAKYKAIIKPKKGTSYTAEEIDLAKRQVYEKAITVIKNKNKVLPIARFDKKILHVSIGPESDGLAASMDLVGTVEHRHFYTAKEALSKMGQTLANYDMIITSLHATTVLTKNDFGMPDQWRSWVSQLPATSQNILLMFGNPLALGSKAYADDKLDAIVIAYENHPFALERTGQFIMGSLPSSGTLPISINEQYKRGQGEQLAWAGRLKESQPEELGISRSKLAQIDTIVAKSISEKAFPGCQILVAIDGKVIYRKSFGHHTYDKKQEVKNTDVYDIASVTKIAASTISLMRLNSEDKFSLNTTLENYLPEVTNNTSYSTIRLKDMMAHQAGLFPWIPFYTETLKNGALNEEIYQKGPSDNCNVQVADNLYIANNYTDVMYTKILGTPLKAKKYKYSDVGYYFVKKIVEKQSGKALDEYVMNEFYLPMGLKYMRYNPAKYFPLAQITPTEYDTIFRRQLIHGYVHDQGAAMMGGVGGHAGVFSNAGDLAALMQMLLNKGSYGGVQYIKPEIVDQYTAYQFYPSNRRGAGFDKPVITGEGGTACGLVSKASYGHSGFTGTLAWADPEYKVNFVFLSNRVYPDAENWKIVKMNIRTDIQKVVYEALLAAKK